MQVLDAAGPLDPAAVKAAGYAGKIGYLAPPINGKPNPKCWTKAEIDAFVSAGLLCGFVFEQGVHNAEDGAAQGTIDGAVARALLGTLGVPGHAGVVVYMAIDENLPYQLWASAAGYLDAAAVELAKGGYLRGGYGMFSLGAQMLKDGHAVAWWQSGAWSGSSSLQGTPGATLYQRIATVAVGGVLCDVNDVWADDWGQWPRPIMEENMSTTPVTIKVDHTTGKGWAVVPGVPKAAFRSITAEAGDDGSLAKVGVSPKAALDGDLIVNADLGTPTLVDVSVNAIVTHV